MLKYAVELCEGGKIRANRGPLSVTSSRRRSIRTSPIKALQRGRNSTVDYEDGFDSASLHEPSTVKLSGDDRHDEPKHDRQCNDDYFPLGEEFEDEIVKDDQQADKKIIKKKYSDDKHDNFAPVMLTFEDSRYISGGPLTGLITRMHLPSAESTKTFGTMLKRASEKDTVDKLQTLIEKVTEFKRRVFRPASDEMKVEVRTDEKTEKEVINESESTNRRTDS